VLVGLTVFLAVGNADARGTPSAQNTALVDVGTTAQVSRQVTAALTTVYSFDYTRLDQQATRAESGGGPQQLAAAGRLTVTAQLVDGTWKIAAVDPR
jgi:Mce-associated membrane protein